MGIGDGGRIVRCSTGKGLGKGLTSGAASGIVLAGVGFLAYAADWHRDNAMHKGLTEEEYSKDFMAVPIKLGIILGVIAWSLLTIM